MVYESHGHWTSNIIQLPNGDDRCLLTRLTSWAGVLGTRQTRSKSQYWHRLEWYKYKCSLIFTAKLFLKKCFYFMCPIFCLWLQIYEVYECKMGDLASESLILSKTTRCRKPFHIFLRRFQDIIYINKMKIIQNNCYFRETGLQWWLDYGRSGHDCSSPALDPSGLWVQTGSIDPFLGAHLAASMTETLLFVAPDAL